MIKIRKLIHIKKLLENEARDCNDLSIMAMNPFEFLDKCGLDDPDSFMTC